ncbi:hypothetical protein LCGC14_2380750, partial [marine sediment metagenome]
MAGIVDPPPNIAPEEWARKRVLPKGSAEPGPFKPERTPYTIPLMRAFWDAIYKRVCGIMASQMGKTDLECNVIGHRIETDPVPCMYFGPTKVFTERTWEPRFMDMVNSTPLKQLLAPGRQPKSSKQINGIRVTFGWAGSVASLSGETACKVMVDERDAMDDNVKIQGDPVEMADGRHETYPDGQTGIFSTPTIGNVEVGLNDDTGIRIMSPTVRISCDEAQAVERFGVEFERIAFGPLEQDGNDFGYKSMAPTIVCEMHKLEICGADAGAVQPEIKKIYPIMGTRMVMVDIRLPINL